MSEIIEIIIPFSVAHNKEIVSKIKDYIFKTAEIYAIKEDVNKEKLKKFLYDSFPFQRFYDDFLIHYVENFMKKYIESIKNKYEITFPYKVRTNFPEIDDMNNVTVTTNKEFVMDLINLTTNEKFKKELMENKYAFKTYFLSFLTEHSIAEIKKFSVMESLETMNYSEYPIDLYNQIFRIKAGL